MLAACNGHVFLVALPGILDWIKEGLSWPLSFSQDNMELLMETNHASFTKFFEDYAQTWSLFARLFLPGPALPHRQVGVTIPRAIPLHLQAEYSLLQLHAEASLADVRSQYRELAKRYHPDAGGHHTDFLALQQAYEQVVEYLQTRR
jgi:DnaJ-domain-containing protein 1